VAAVDRAHAVGDRGSVALKAAKAIRAATVIGRVSQSL